MSCPFTVCNCGMSLVFIEEIFLIWTTRLLPYSHCAVYRYDCMWRIVGLKILGIQQKICRRICGVWETNKWTVTMVNKLSLCVAVCIALSIAARTTSAAFNGEWRSEYIVAVIPYLTLPCLRGGQVVTPAQRWGRISSAQCAAPM